MTHVSLGRAMTLQEQPDLVLARGVRHCQAKLYLRHFRRAAPVSHDIDRLGAYQCTGVVWEKIAGSQLT